MEFTFERYPFAIRSWLDAVGTPIAVQQRPIRHSDIRTTMNRELRRRVERWPRAFRLLVPGGELNPQGGLREMLSER